jgi:hypothetical protein
MAKRSVRVSADTSVYGGEFEEDFADPSRTFFDEVRARGYRLLISPVMELEISGMWQPISMQNRTSKVIPAQVENQEKLAAQLWIPARSMRE